MGLSVHVFGFYANVNFHGHEQNCDATIGTNRSVPICAQTLPEFFRFSLNVFPALVDFSCMIRAPHLVYRIPVGVKLGLNGPGIERRLVDIASSRALVFCGLSCAVLCCAVHTGP